MAPTWTVKLMEQQRTVGWKLRVHIFTCAATIVSGSFRHLMTSAEIIKSVLRLVSMQRWWYLSPLAFHPCPRACQIFLDAITTSGLGKDSRKYQTQSEINNETGEDFENHELKLALSHESGESNDLIGYEDQENKHPHVIVHAPLHEQTTKGRSFPLLSHGSPISAFSKG